jgi:hypothetical protein
MAAAREAVGTALADVGASASGPDDPDSSPPVARSGDAGTREAADRVPAPSAPASAGSLSSDQIDDLVVVLEERLLAEIERRGGRYAGVF